MPNVLSATTGFFHSSCSNVTLSTVTGRSSIQTVQVRSRRRFLVRIALFLLVAVFAVGALAWFFALPLEARYYARRLPLLLQTPVPVRDSSFTKSVGREIGFCGCGFEVPWRDLEDAKTKTGGNSATLYFDSGLVTLLKCEPPREFVEGVLSSTKMSPETFRRAFGEDALDSDYALTNLMLETRPMSFHTPPDQQGPLMAMLVLKAIATPTADSGIFAIHTQEFKGFQYQDPQASPKWVLVDLFAADRGLEFQFFLHDHGASPHVSQADINRIVRTVHKTSPFPPPNKSASLVTADVTTR